ncbi:uncharacterized protein GLRG_04706 [Colletotrichum graminicola M1.001]|uniref:Uncharacterized protein n=1 Tax=Colletotrichum graminicola (strain M1.001 / M2 / FGSC 10212) TaxID=645133 RepID=E3QFC4_COLGM|nr:uncharacterized protein GLRG_04706 [Colletotrichum graminicola M1.001]EFQ29562.1 hypothetical protein GLRG_04706 [Colletotrichum graminicola M1.001]
MVNVKHNYQCHIERIFFNHPRNRRHNVLARSKLNQLQPDGDQNLEPHYGNRFFLAKYFVSNLLAEYWKYNQYTRFSRNIRSLNVDFHHLSRLSYVNRHFLDWASSAPYLQQRESYSSLECNSDNDIYK